MANPAGGPNVFEPTVKPTGKHKATAEKVTTTKSGTVHGQKVDHMQNNSSS